MHLLTMIASYNNSSLSSLLLRRSRGLLLFLRSSLPLDKDKYSSDNAASSYASFRTSSSSHHATLPIQERLTYNRDKGIVSRSTSASSSIQQLYQTIWDRNSCTAFYAIKLFSSAPTRHHNNDNDGMMSNNNITSANTHELLPSL